MTRIRYKLEECGGEAAPLVPSPAWGRGHLITSLCLTVVLSTAAAHAQRPGGGRGGPPGFGGGPPGFHLMSALDTNEDGKLSAKEIEAAAVALQKLDKDNDGKLSSEEIGWPPNFGRFGGGPGGFGRGGPPGFGGPPERPRRPGAEDTAKRRRSRNSGRFFTAAQLLRLDRDKDGQVSKDEIPKVLQATVLGRVDTNKDGVLDKDELSKLDAAKDKKKQ